MSSRLKPWQRVETERIQHCRVFDVDRVWFHLPGLNKDEVEINVHDGTLSISGERRQEETEEGRQVKDWDEILKLLQQQGSAGRK